jgi:hypothetical protein
MSKQIKVLAVFVFAIAFIVTGCKNNNSPVSPIPGSSAPANSTVLLRAQTYTPAALRNDAVKIKKVGSSTYIQFPIVSGSLDVQSAWVNFKNLVIEENSGFDGQGNGGYDGQGDGGAQTEGTDVNAPGPFSLDLSSGTASLGSFLVHAGTFKKVDFQLTPNSADPYLGKTIVISGSYTPTSGSAVPFTLKSDLTSQMQLPLANGGVTVIADSTVSLNIIIDLPGLFNGMDFSTAAVTNGQILIDSQNNAALLTHFETNLHQYVEADGEGGGTEPGGEGEGGGEG